MATVKKKDLLEQIWKSKLSYCQIHDRAFTIPDVIVSDLKEVTEPDLTIRLDTDRHIPLATAQGKGKHGHLEGTISFVPFILYRSSRGPSGKIEFKEVARSHHRNGMFDARPPRSGMTDRLARMVMEMVASYSRKGNWRGYSWIEDMGSEALVNLTINVLKYDEAKSDNPHAYITRCVETTFLREIRKHKRQGEIRDQLLMDEGLKPSHGAQANK